MPRLLLFSLHFALEFAVGDELVRLRFLSPPIDLEIAQDERAFAVSLEKNKWVRRKKTRRVKHIGIVVARRDDQASLAGHFLALAHRTFLRAKNMLVIPRLAKRAEGPRTRRLVQRTSITRRAT